MKKKDFPLFSIVIPAFNREKTIKRTIDSVINQTYTNLEIIVIDDGSTDNTRNVVLGLINDDKIKYIYQDNQGAQVARNNGLKRAKGEYILFLDSDDWLFDDCISKVVEFYKNNELIDAVYYLTGLYKKGKIVSARNDYLQGNVYEKVLEQGYLTSSSFITMKKNIFDKIGEWDTLFPSSQDDDICFRIAKHCKIGLINEILGVYGTDAGKGNQIGSSPMRVAYGWWLLWKKYKKDVIQFCGKETYVKHIEECIYRFAEINNEEYIKKCLELLSHYSSKNKYKSIKRNVVKHIIIGRIKNTINFIFEKKYC